MLFDEALFLCVLSFDCSIRLDLKGFRPAALTPQFELSVVGFQGDVIIIAQYWT